MSSQLNNAPEREFTFGDKEFRFISELVYRHTGIVLADHKRDMVYSRLARRLRALGMNDFAHYCDYVSGERAEEEMGNLVNAITTNLTSFFREGHHFEHLSKIALPPILSRPQKRLRIWSAGCSSGMEPYSIALTLRDSIPKIDAWDARILATDIDTNMLKKGENGLYPASEMERIPAHLRGRLERRKDQILMPKELKSLIAFKHLNLLGAWPMKGSFDIVFCRNVIIYFDKKTQVKLFERISNLLPPGGWLYVGHSENLMHVSDRFELTGRSVYRRIA